MTSPRSNLASALVDGTAIDPWSVVVAPAASPNLPERTLVLRLHVPSLQFELEQSGAYIPGGAEALQAWVTEQLSAQPFEMRIWLLEMASHLYQARVLILGKWWLPLPPYVAWRWCSHATALVESPERLAIQGQVTPWFGKRRRIHGTRGHSLTCSNAASGRGGATAGAA